MKNTIKAVAVLAVATFFASCNSNDDTIINNTNGTGSLNIEFDNAFAGNDLILQTQPYQSGNETLRITTAKYIVSNIVLTDKNGTVFTYPKSESYFIVDESKPSSLVFNLKNVPSGDYTQIKFGIGVDQAQWEAGADGQANLIAQAQEADLFWTWAAGYKFLAFEGNFTSPTITSEAAFMVHTGKTGTDYNYTEVSLHFPGTDTALVRPTITPQVHIVADLSKILDGTNKINLSEAAMVMGGAKLALITANLSDMFSVNHVHND